MVSLTFTQFHLEEDAGCGYDWLAVYDGPSARAAQLGRYCGTQLPGDNGTLVATRNVVTMEFRYGTQSKMFGRDEISKTICVILKNIWCYSIPLPCLPRGLTRAWRTRGSG